MANKITYAAGTYSLGNTASRFTANTNGGNVTLNLPSIAEQQRFQEFGSGLNVAGTFNFAFEKIGSGQLIFNVGVDGDTINGSTSVVINDIGSGIIFISSDNSWGIVNFSQSTNQNNTSRVNVSIDDYNKSDINAPITIVPAKNDNLIIATHIIVTIVEADSSGAPVRLAYGYGNKNTPIGTVELTGLKNGAKVIVPIIDTQNYQDIDPVGSGFVAYKLSGSTAIKIYVPNFEIEGFVGN